jgi:hypothetical protein
MSIGWILFIIAVSIAALYVIFRPKRVKDDDASKFNWGPPGVSKGYSGGKTIIVHGEPALGVSVAAHPTATGANRATAARARQRARVSRDEGVDTSITDALLLATVLDDGSAYVEPERAYVPDPTPETYVAPTPTYHTPSYQSDDGGRGGYDGGSGGGSDSGGSSDGGGGGGGD